jgi:hypothetical protein
MANTGVTAVLPAPPPSAVVVMSFFDAADKLTSATLALNPAPLLTSASVWSMPMFSAIAAPMPNLPASACLPVALTVFSTKFSDEIVMFLLAPVIVTCVSTSR